MMLKQLTILVCVLVQQKVVSGCRYSYFGENCDGVCHCMDNSFCYKTDGSCGRGGCDLRYRGYSCQECQIGRYGRVCEAFCHCKKDELCFGLQGYCPDGQCAPGYTFQSSKCQTKCEQGRFGDRCSGYCHCENQASCHHVNGTCDQNGCAAGYKGDNCQRVSECEDGLYGNNCEGTCHCSGGEPCHKRTGVCKSGCAPGYKGGSCQLVCDTMNFGLNCSKSCHCAPDVKCDHVTGCQGSCAVGYTGDDCQHAVGVKDNTAVTIGVAIGTSGILIAVLIATVVLLINRRKSLARSRDLPAAFEVNTRQEASQGTKTDQSSGRIGDFSSQHDSIHEYDDPDEDDGYEKPIRRMPWRQPRDSETFVKSIVPHGAPANGRSEQPCVGTGDNSAVRRSEERFDRKAYECELDREYRKVQLINSGQDLSYSTPK